LTAVIDGYVNMRFADVYLSYYIPKVEIYNARFSTFARARVILLIEVIIRYLYSTLYYIILHDIIGAYIYNDDKRTEQIVHILLYNTTTDVTFEGTRNL